MQQTGNENQTKAYFESIETDEFVMPDKFEVEIRMQDNQVSYHNNLNNFYNLFYRLNESMLK